MKNSSNQSKREDKNFILTKATSMQPFKIEIYSEEFLTILADVVSNTGTKYHAIDDMVDDIHKPIEMKIDSDVYKELMNIGERKDIELVCKYVAVQRILNCSNDSKFTGMIDRVRSVIRQLPMATRHVITGEIYRRLFAIIPAAYLCSVCNMGRVHKEVDRMDKGVVKTMSNIMAELDKLTAVDPNVISEGYSAVVDVVVRTMEAYRDHNIIDLGNLVKMISEMFDGKYGEYFSKLINMVNKDISDSFAKFDKLVMEVKDSNETEFTDDKPDPMEYDPIDQSEMDAAMGVEVDDNQPVDLNNDSVLGPDATTEVNTGLDDSSSIQPTPTDQPSNVVTGLESVSMNESLFRKKLKRISRESIGYVKVRGANARDADELTMIISYGYYVAEKCEWYMDIIQREDDRYVVPQTYAELENIKNEMYRTIDSLMKDPIFRKRGSIYSNRGIDLF